MCNKIFTGACPLKSAVRAFNRKSVGTAGYAEHARTHMSSTATRKDKTDLIRVCASTKSLIADAAALS